MSEKYFTEVDESFSRCLNIPLCNARGIINSQPIRMTYREYFRRSVWAIALNIFAILVTMVVCFEFYKHDFGEIFVTAFLICSGWLWAYELLVTVWWYAKPYMKEDESSSWQTGSHYESTIHSDGTVTTKEVADYSSSGNSHAFRNFFAFNFSLIGVVCFGTLLFFGKMYFCRQNNDVVMLKKYDEIWTQYPPYRPLLKRLEKDLHQAIKKAKKAQDKEEVFRYDKSRRRNPRNRTFYFLKNQRSIRLKETKVGSGNHPYQSIYTVAEYIKGKYYEVTYAIVEDRWVPLAGCRNPDGSYNNPISTQDVIDRWR